MTSLELNSSGTAEFDEGDVYFIGNATTLIRFGGLTILTDPAFLHCVELSEPRPSLDGR